MTVGLEALPKNGEDERLVYTVTQAAGQSSLKNGNGTRRDP
jgi:hypothetical protein